MPPDSKADPRAWCLSALKIPAFAQDLLSPKRPAAPKAQASDPDQVEDIVPVGFQAEECAPLGVDSDLLPYLVQIVQTTVKTRCQERPVSKPSGLFISIFRNPDRHLVAKARSLLVQDRQRRYEAGPGARKAWEQAVPAFRALPGARERLEAWLIADREAHSASPDSGGFLDLQTDLLAALNRLVQLAQQALTPSEVQQMTQYLDSTLRASGLKPETFVWKRAWEFHWSKRVLAAVGLGDPQ